MDIDNTINKVKKFSKSRASFKNFRRTKGIFYNFEDGDNILRLVGEFVECRQHFIAPNPKHGDRGLCIIEAFKGTDSLPKVINCLDWDSEKEEPTEKKTCPICMLNKIVRKALKEGSQSLSAEDKKFLENLRHSTNVNTTLKWNVIDRKSPHIIEIQDDDTEKQVLGYKVANIGLEAFGDIEGIYSQIDPTDPAGIDEGVDINIRKGYNGIRPCYSAQIVMQGTRAKETPLTDEEKEMVKHDLHRLIGKHTDSKKIIDSLHEDLRQLLENSENSSLEESEVLEEPEETEETEKPKEEIKTNEKLNKFVSKPLNETFGFDDNEKDEKTNSEGEEEKESQWQCFGTCEDETHPECSQCDSLQDCLEEKKKRSGKKRQKTM